MDPSEKAPDDEDDTFLDTIGAFLALFNGDWQDWRTGGLWHFCKMGCRCGGASRSEFGARGKLLFCKLVLGRKPHVPALNRWLKCRITAKWFYLAFAVHGVYLHGSVELYKLRGTTKQTLQKECQSLQHELSALVQTSSEPSAASVSAFILPDLPICKIIRVRARKSADWVTSRAAAVNLAISLESTEPATHFSHWLFAQQRESWLTTVDWKQAILI